MKLKPQHRVYYIRSEKERGKRKQSTQTKRTQYSVTHDNNKREEISSVATTCNAYR